MEGLGLGRAYVRLPGSNLTGAVVRRDGNAANNRASRLDECVTCIERHEQNIKGIECYISKSSSEKSGLAYTNPSDGICRLAPPLW
jgi:hypothetical protein